MLNRLSKRLGLKRSKRTVRKGPAKSKKAGKKTKKVGHKVRGKGKKGKKSKKSKKQRGGCGCNQKK